MALPPDLDALDLELDAAIERGAMPVRLDMDDQATRLRRLVEASTGIPAPSVPAAAPASIAQSPARTGLAKVIAVASGKGGVGKTNVSVNLSVVLASRGLRVVLLDADLGTANADVLCGLTPAARLNHLVTALPVHDGARRTAGEILVDAPGGFRLVPGSAGVARMADLSPSEQRMLLMIIGELESLADVIVVDTAAGVGRSVTSLVEAADMGIVVTTPEPTSIADAYALIKCVVLSENGHWNAEQADRVHLVVNQSESAHEAEAVQARINAVCHRFLGVRTGSLGQIAQDLRVAQAVRARTPFVLHAPESPATRDMVAVGDRVIHQLGLRLPSDAAPPRRGFRSVLARILLG